MKPFCLERTQLQLLISPVIILVIIYIIIGGKR
jgi:hypothetical protein